MRRPRMSTPAIRPAPASQTRPPPPARARAGVPDRPSPQLRAGSHNGFDSRYAIANGYSPTLNRIMHVKAPTRQASPNPGLLNPSHFRGGGAAGPLTIAMTTRTKAIETVMP